MIDGHGGSVAQTATFNVTGINDAPVALNDSATVNSARVIAANTLLANGTDPYAGDSRSVTAVGTAGHGSVVLGGANNTLLLSAQDVLNLHGSGDNSDVGAWNAINAAGSMHQFKIEGNSGDAVNLTSLAGSSWTHQADSNGYQVYEDATKLVQLLINAQITTHVI